MQHTELFRPITFENALNRVGTTQRICYFRKNLILWNFSICILVIQTLSQLHVHFVHSFTHYNFFYSLNCSVHPNLTSFWTANQRLTTVQDYKCSEFVRTYYQGHVGRRNIASERPKLRGLLAVTRRFILTLETREIKPLDFQKVQELLKRQEKTKICWVQS